MSIKITETKVKSILTRTTGYLTTVSSHSLQPYRGCSFGSSLCGVGCYVQHNYFVTRKARWGSFLDVRVNAAEIYAKQYSTELAWARREKGEFSIFMSSSTDPFVPQEHRYKISKRIFLTMVENPPDELIIQTHSHLVTTYSEIYKELATGCYLRFHISIESDRDQLPGLPPPASSVDHRFGAAEQLRKAGFRVIVTVSPLLPIAKPVDFFKRIASVADAVVIDHFIEGDGSQNGSRTNNTALPAAMARVDPVSVTLDYREKMIDLAHQVMPGRVGVGVSGFAGNFIPA